MIEYLCHIVRLNISKTNEEKRLINCHNIGTNIIFVVIHQMAVAADATAQSIEGQNDPKNDSLIIDHTPSEKSHIKEHPFMKEVRSYSSFYVVENSFNIF